MYVLKLHLKYIRHIIKNILCIWCIMSIYWIWKFIFKFWKLLFEFQICHLNLKIDILSLKIVIEFEFFCFNSKIDISILVFYKFEIFYLNLNFDSLFKILIWILLIEYKKYISIILLKLEKKNIEAQNGYLNFEK